VPSNRSPCWLDFEPTAWFRRTVSTVPFGIITGSGGLGGGTVGAGVATWTGAVEAGVESGFCAASGGDWFRWALEGDDGLLLVQAETRKKRASTKLRRSYFFMRVSPTTNKITATVCRLKLSHLTGGMLCQRRLSCGCRTGVGGSV